MKKKIKRTLPSTTRPTLEEEKKGAEKKEIRGLDLFSNKAGRQEGRQAGRKTGKQEGRQEGI